MNQEFDRPYRRYDYLVILWLESKAETAQFRGWASERNQTSLRIL